MKLIDWSSAGLVQLTGRGVVTALLASGALLVGIGLFYAAQSPAREEDYCESAAPATGDWLRALIGATKPEVLVTASVVDVETGQPIKEFRVVPGTPYGVAKNTDPSVAIWQPHLLRAAADGRFEWPAERSYEHFCLRFEADGYATKLSPWIKKAAGPRELVMKLRRDPGIVGRVLRPDGQPAAGAVLAVAMPNRDVRLENGKVSGADDPPPTKPSDRWRRPILTKADAQGRYRVPTEPGAALVFAVHEAGIAEVSYDTLNQAADIRLAAWGALDGRVLWIDKPGADEKLYVGMMREAHGYPVSSMFQSVTTDNAGRFRVDKLPPWQVQISRTWELPNNRGYSFPSRHLDVASGRPTTVVFGGPGRPVTGKLVGLDSYEGITLGITPNTPRPGDQLAGQGHALVRQSNIGPVFFREKLPVNKDGSFRIDNVIPENYQLFVRNADNSVYQVHQLRVMQPPADKPEQPHDAGEIKVARRQAN